MVIKNGFVISNSTYGFYDILIENGKIKKIEKNIESNDFIDANGLIITPGLIDMHAHFREPGYEYKETIETGLNAAIHGGVTSVAIMPNTNPSLDNINLIKELYIKSKDINLSNLFFIPAITKNRGSNELIDYESFKELDDLIVGFSDDGSPVSNSYTMYNAAQKLNKPIIDHCEEKSIFKLGHIRDCSYAKENNISIMPEIVETINVYRDIEIARDLNKHFHIAHISTRETLEIIKRAKENNVPISCEITQHHLLLNCEDIENTNYKVNPPLPTLESQKALIKGVKDGLIDIIASDHAPHSKEDKNKSFNEAAFGISGIETILPSIIKISEDNNIELKKLINMCTHNPAKIFNLKNKGDILEGFDADICIFDKDRIIEINEKFLKSKGKNTPFINKQLKGKVIYTIVNGEIKYKED